MFKTKVISGFPGVGKSHFHKNNPDLIILDSDSSSFSWVEKGVRNPDFPNNYIRHIKENLGKVNVILLSSHKQVRDALRENDIGYTMVYPDKSLKHEYLSRYKGRGSDENFLGMIDKNWDGFIDELETEEYPIKITLKEGQYLQDVYKPEPRIVMCNGICTSQLDDYCGMHMSNETCPACDSIWKQAHLENELFNSR
jgi:hypothetical protein